MWRSLGSPTGRHARGRLWPQARPHRARTMSVCAANAWVGTEILGIGFVSCDRDCVGSAVTDLLLALHALACVVRLRSRLRERRRWLGAIDSVVPPGASFASFATVASGLMLSNAIWSGLGALYWWQPGGRKIVGFEVLWRLNAQCQASLLYFAYRVALTLVRISALCPAITRHERALERVARVHAICFGAVCLIPSACAQRDYVLWGGLNIMPPLVRAALTTRLAPPSQLTSQYTSLTDVPPPLCEWLCS